jgi:hypothetical protein
MQPNALNIREAHQYPEAIDEASIIMVGLNNSTTQQLNKKTYSSQFTVHRLQFTVPSSQITSPPVMSDQKSVISW